MRAEDLFNALDGKNGIESIKQYPSTIIIHLKKDIDFTSRENIIHKDSIIEICTQDSFYYETLMELFNQKEKKKILNAIMEALAGCLVPLMPMLICASMFKTVASILGPDMLNVISSESTLYILFTFVADAGFYFFPIVVGYTSAKTFHATPVLGMFLGAILIHPTLIEMAVNHQSFNVYGIPMTALNYTSTILPIILSTWILSYLERFFNKVIPEAIKVVFAPFLTFLIMLPVTLCLVAPLGNLLGEYLCNALLTLGNMGGIIRILTIALLGMVWEFIIMGGLHWLFISTIFMILASNGQEAIITPMCAAAAFAVGGMCLGAFLRQKNKKDKSATISYLIAQIIGGITEPGLYGIGFRYKKPFIGLMAGGFAGALYAAIMNVTAYNFLPVANFLCFLNYIGGNTTNFIHGIVSGIIGFVTACVVTYILGVEESYE
ncbi:MAG: PTS transporter subunit EIIC [Floccifex porci]|uniref:PTS transporter subunit EIIC n=1 Tax=Floccifex porci TaxID=2606629 RepID=UPI0023F3C7C2|nr:PTS transporter subunit EIIC [Floccifex porci]MCI7802269.1 PTS transporter subunit EIIC [Erysipelotrichaceae bacterium]MDD7466929.1 PTS transporter subunit EIIC [Floccifex porci]MDY4796451.1 PTS transporter subunit EIIC [Floccifex porci]